MSEPFTVGDSGEEHTRGAECSVDWCGEQGYPHRCEQPGCNGYVHAAFGDEDSDCNYWLYTKCDICGESE